MRSILFLAVVTIGFFIFCGAAPAARSQNTPPLTPAQQAYANAYSLCVGQYNDQNIPFSQFHSFMSACLRANGITAYVAVPADQIPPAPSSQTGQ